LRNTTACFILKVPTSNNQTDHEDKWEELEREGLEREGLEKEGLRRKRLERECPKGLFFVLALPISCFTVIHDHETYFLKILISPLPPIQNQI
jgi:hypothetical protein